MTELERFAAWRGIRLDDICPECSGSGTRTYAMMVAAQCDACWGSGSKSHPWCDMRALAEEYPELAEKLRNAGRPKR